MTKMIDIKVKDQFSQILDAKALLRAAPETTHARRALVLFGLVCLQATIGILTLIWQVPLGWALAHQGGALVVLGFAIAHWRGFYGEYPREIADD